MPSVDAARFRPVAARRTTLSARSGGRAGAQQPASRPYLDDPPAPPTSGPVPTPLKRGFWTRLWQEAYKAGAHVLTWLKQPLMPTLATKRTVVGYAVDVEAQPNVDGDIDIDVAPILPERDVLDFRGRYRPVPPAEVEQESPGMSARARSMLEAGAVHCEVKDNARARLMPEIQQLRALEAQGKTPMVAITGRWTYDPFHEGWTEIHPVSGIRILANDYDPSTPAAGGGN